MQLSSLAHTFVGSEKSAATRPRRGWVRRIILLLGLGLAAVVAVRIAHIFALGNIHEVAPGRVYRSSQLSAAELDSLIRKRGIRTVVNLRGSCIQFDWYQAECQVTQNHQVSQEDITLSANRMPPPAEIHRLIEILDQAEYPILFHCRQGADRTGLAAALFLMLKTDTDYAVARRQCSPLYGHVRMLTTANMDRFFDMYEDWLGRHGWVHSPDRVRRWALEDYRADPAPAHIQLLDAVPILMPGQAITLRARVRNLSNSVWEFKPGSYASVHVRFNVFDEANTIIGNYRAGRYEARVQPGESIDVDLPLPPFTRPGRYRVWVDVADKHVSLCQLGSEPLEFEIIVTEEARR